MKKFIFKISYIILPILFFSICLEIATRNIPNDYKTKDKYIKANGSKIQTLILGNSHTFYGVNPIYFRSNTYNLAFLSQSVEYDYRLWDRYKNELKNLKTVIVPISLFTLHSTMESDGCGWMIKNYNIYMDVHSSSEPKYNFEIFSEKIRPLLEKNYLYYKKDSTYSMSKELGWASRKGTKKGKSIIDYSMDAFQRHSVDTNLYVADNIKTLHTFINELDKRKIKIILITTPTYKSYYNLVVAKNQYKEIQKELLKIDSTYSNCIYINSINDDRFLDSDFYDGDHLNEVGAKKYSLFLDSIVNNKTKE